MIRRKILESRIKQEIKKNDIVKAEKLLEELKRVKSFERMAEQVESVQRKALSTERGPVQSGVAKRIESMLDTTRQLMQRYLQDAVVRTLEIEIENTGKALAHGDRVCDPMPAELTFLHYPRRARIIRGGACFEVGTLAPGDKRTYVVETRVDRNARSGTVVNTANATAENADRVEATAKIRVKSSVVSAQQGVTG